MSEHNGVTKLSMDALENVIGGVNRTINTGVDGLNAAIRIAPGKGNKQIASLVNGTTVNTLTDPIYDQASGRNWVQIEFTDKYGQLQTGWVAASILGYRR